MAYEILDCCFALISDSWRVNIRALGPFVTKSKDLVGGYTTSVSSLFSIGFLKLFTLEWASSFIRFSPRLSLTSSCCGGLGLNLGELKLICWSLVVLVESAMLNRETSEMPGDV